MSRRLAIVTHYWAPHIGGVETIAREQAHRLHALGWDVGVFTTRLGDDPACALDGQVRVHRYRCVNWAEQRLRLPVPLPAPRMLTDLVRFGRDGDLVLVHGHCYPGSFFGALAARATGRPLVVVQSNPLVDYPFPLSLVERVVDGTIGRWVLQQARIVVCVSRHVQDYVRRIAPGAHTTMIYSGVDTGRFCPGPAPGRAPGAGLRVLTLRRLVPRNGVDVLIEAWRRAALGPGAQLTVAGSGPELGRLQHAARDLPSVRFLGRVPGDQLPAMYRDADVFVIPSVNGEGYGIVAAEALACGVPVIATTGGATGELVRHGVDGLVVPARDPSALAAAISQLDRDPAALSRMTAAAQARGPELSWAAAIDQLAATLAASCTGPAPAGLQPQEVQP